MGLRVSERANRMKRTAELDRSQRAQREKQRQDARLKGFNANDYVRAASRAGHSNFHDLS